MNWLKLISLILDKDVSFFWLVLSVSQLKEIHWYMLLFDIQAFLIWK